MLEQTNRQTPRNNDPRPAVGGDGAPASGNGAALDVDGDGQPDALVPNLGDPVQPGGSSVGANRWEAVVAADMPTRNPSFLTDGTS